MNPYTLIIAASVIIILSFIFNVIAKKTNIPSVLMLILLGVIIQTSFWTPPEGEAGKRIMTLLEVLGNVGLIFIVLEAALDLELRRDKASMITKSFFIALLALLASSFSIAGLFILLWKVSLFNALIYAVPLSIMSSAIIIPSVSSLKEEKKEFMIYESTFSDILGIMFFYFLKGNAHASSTQEVFFGVTGNIGITVLIAVIASYLLVVLFQQLKMHAKYFLMFAVLLLLYAVGKSFHLSSLLIILFFGLVLNNSQVFFRGPLMKFGDKSLMKESLHELHVITLETAFVLRTFFFVIFGITISLTSLIDWKLGVISIIIVALLFIVRFIFLKIFLRKDIIPQLWIAPRGLITVLLFFAIPNGMVDEHGEVLKAYDPYMDYTIREFDQGILLFTILITSVIMTVSLIMNRGDKVTEVLLDSIKMRPNDNNIIDTIEDSLTFEGEEDAEPSSDEPTDDTVV
jgi:NhaP-type Na+/H+ or K+/H+ antiporter